MSASTAPPVTWSAFRSLRRVIRCSPAMGVKAPRKSRDWSNEKGCRGWMWTFIADSFARATVSLVSYFRRATLFVFVLVFFVVVLAREVVLVERASEQLRLELERLGLAPRVAQHLGEHEHRLLPLVLPGGGVLHHLA